METKANKLILRSVFVSAIMFLSVWIFAGPSSAVAGDGEAAPTAQATDGAAAAIDAAPLWAKNCKSCHGEDGKGQTKAGQMKNVRDLTDAQVRAAFDRARMIASLTKGMTDEAGKVQMKPYGEKLTDAEIAALIDYVFALPH